MEDDAHARGLAFRQKIMGDVAGSSMPAGKYAKPLEDWENEFVWGLVWSRPGIPVKTRFMINLGMMVALNRPNELREQMRGALKNGCTKEEVVEVLLQANAYCGGPAGVDAFRAVREVFAEHDAGSNAPQKSGEAS